MLAQGQAYPVKPIRFVVPFNPGGGNDILARAIAPRMAESLGQPVIVDNRPGAGGNIGTEMVREGAPDGYTILIASNQVTINPALDAKLPFDLERDFAPVGMIASVPDRPRRATRSSRSRRCRSSSRSRRPIRSSSTTAAREPARRSISPASSTPG